MKTTMKKARYARISTPDQKVERQLINDNPDEDVYIDVCSGSIPFEEREQGAKLLDALDVTYVSVHAIDRLGRNLLDILTTLKHFEDKGITVDVGNIGKSRLNGKKNEAFDLIVTVMGQVAQMERNTMLERQKEGIAIAKAKGEYKGRVRGSKDSKETILKRYDNVVKKLKKGTMTLREIAKNCGVSPMTVQKVKKLLNEPSQ